MSSYVYTITNVVTGQVYVGKTNEPVRRWTIHRYHGRRQSPHRSHLYNNMKCYGLQNFEFKVTAKAPSEEDAYRLEVETIAALKKQGVRLLNNTLGGEGVRLTAGGRVEHSQRMRLLWKDPVFRAKMMRRRTRCGHQLSLKTRRAISESLKYSWSRDPVKAAKRIENHRSLLRTTEFREKVSLKQKDVQQRPEVKAKVAAARVRRNEHMREKVNAIIAEYVPYKVSYVSLAKKYELTVTQVKGIVHGKLYAYLVNVP